MQIILKYSRHRRLFTIRVEDSETTGHDWDEVLRNERINRAYLLFSSVPRLNVNSGKVLPSYLSYILAQMVSQKLAAYEPPKQDRSVLIYWRLPEEWAEVLHEWVRLSHRDHCFTFSLITIPQVSSTGHLNTIMTFYEITDPPIDSPLSGLPIPLLRQAITILSKTNRAQIIAIADGEGVRFFPSTGKA